MRAPSVMQCHQVGLAAADPAWRALLDPEALGFVGASFVTSAPVLASAHPTPRG